MIRSLPALRAIAAAALLVVAFVPGAIAGTVKLESAHSVARTLDRLVAAARAEGCTVISRVNLSKVMQDRGYVIPDEEVVIFTAPVFGEQAERDAIGALGLELSAKAFVLRDQVWLTYESIDTVARSKSLDPADPTLVRMEEVVSRIMEKATAP